MIALIMVAVLFGPAMDARPALSFSISPRIVPKGIGSILHRQGKYFEFRAGAGNGSSVSDSCFAAEEVAEKLVGSSTQDAATKVFYNKAGVVSRDLSVLMANLLVEERRKEVEQKMRRCSSSSGGQEYAAGGNAPETGDSNDSTRATGDEYELAVLDAFAGSGVRALRYAGTSSLLSVTRPGLSTQLDILVVGNTRRSWKKKCSGILLVPNKGLVGACTGTSSQRHSDWKMETRIVLQSNP